MKEPDTLDLFASLTEPETKTEEPKQAIQNEVPSKEISTSTGIDDDKKTAPQTQLQEQVSDLVSTDTPVRQPRVKKKGPKSSRHKGRRKEGGAFKTISELATYLNVPQHVLRFWETKFSQIKPMKRGGGRRYYRPEDVQVVERIHHLLYNEGYTIKGVQRLIRISSKQEFLEGTSSVTIEVSATKETAPQTSEKTQGKKGEDKGEDASEKTEEAMRTILRGLKDIRRELAS